MKNVGTTDRVIRFALGIVLLSLLFLLPSPYAWFGLIGVVPLATSLSGYCPLYQAFGVSTQHKTA